MASIGLNWPQRHFSYLDRLSPITILAQQALCSKPESTKSVQRKAKRKCQKETSLKSRLIATKIDHDSSSASSASLSGLTISLSSLSGLTISFSSCAPLTFRNGDHCISLRRRWSLSAWEDDDHYNQKKIIMLTAQKPAFSSSSLLFSMTSGSAWAVSSIYTSDYDLSFEPIHYN